MLNDLPSEVKIIEVGPRDGLQNEKTVLDTATKLEYIRLLSKTGLKTIEATSFVRADKIPQMGDAKALYEGVQSLSLDSSISTPCLVPNLKGLDLALQCGVREIAVFTATSDTFNKKNINATVDESLTRLAPVIDKAKSEGLKVRGYISTVFGCPYEGKTSLDNLLKVSHFLEKAGCYEISLGDTIGVGHPILVKKVIGELEREFDLSLFAMHFHDTSGTALANILTSLEYGIKAFDSSSAGLGGCPYAKGATGNVATEDVINLLHSMGVSTGVDMELLTEASTYILSSLKKHSSSKFYNAYLGRKS